MDIRNEVAAIRRQYDAAIDAMNRTNFHPKRFTRRTDAIYIAQRKEDLKQENLRKKRLNRY